MDAIISQTPKLKSFFKEVGQFLYDILFSIALTTHFLKKNSDALHDNLCLFLMKKSDIYIYTYIYIYIYIYIYKWKNQRGRIDSLLLWVSRLSTRQIYTYIYIYIYIYIIKSKLYHFYLSVNSLNFLRSFAICCFLSDLFIYIFEFVISIGLLSRERSFWETE